MEFTLAKLLIKVTLGKAIQVQSGADVGKIDGLIEGSLENDGLTGF